MKSFPMLLLALISLTGGLYAGESFTLKKGGASITGELRSIMVPENRNEIDSPHIELVYLHLKSNNPNPKPPLIYLAGGPGVSGIDNLKNAVDALVLPFLEERDVIALDQRGTGRSHQLPNCDLDQGMPTHEAATREDYEARARETARACADFWRAQGVDLEAYNTEQNADDVDAVRRALGVEKVALWGGSYGSHLALSVLRRHEQHIDRVLLNGIEGPDHTLKLPSQAQAVLERLDQKAAELPAMEGRSLLEIMETVISRLEKEPAMAYYNDDQGREVTVAISAFDVQLLTARQLRGPKHMKKVPAAYLRMLDGDFNFLAVPVAEMRSPRLVRPMHILTDAASGVSAGRLARIERERRDTLLGDAPNMCMAAAMEGLGIPSLSDAFRAPVRSRVPVLMVSGTLDGKTPPANGEAVLKGFSNGGHIVVEGAGHGGRILTGGQVWPLVWDFMQGGQPASVTVPHKSMPDAIPMNAKQLQAYEGSYAMPEGPAVFTAGDGVLHVIYKGRDLELKPQTQRRFFSLDPKVQVTFNLDESGGVNGLITRIQGRTVTAPKQL